MMTFLGVVSLIVVTYLVTSYLLMRAFWDDVLQRGFDQDNNQESMAEAFDAAMPLLKGE
jgi:hypothetical protein